MRILVLDGCFVVDRIFPIESRGKKPKAFAAACPNSCMSAGPGEVGASTVTPIRGPLRGLPYTIIRDNSAGFMRISDRFPVADFVTPPSIARSVISTETVFTVSLMNPPIALAVEFDESIKLESTGLIDLRHLHFRPAEHQQDLELLLRSAYL